MSYSKTSTQIRNMLPQYLDMIGVSTKKPFNCLNPEHDDKNPSMSFDAKDGQHVKCFSCNAYWDISDLIAINELGASVIGNEVQYNFKDAYNKALQVMGVSGAKMQQQQSEQKPSKSEQEVKEQNQLNEDNTYLITHSFYLLRGRAHDPNHKTNLIFYTLHHCANILRSDFCLVTRSSVLLTMSMRQKDLGHFDLVPFSIINEKDDL